MKAYYIRTDSAPIKELEFNNYGLAQQVAQAMSNHYCMGSYKSLYVVRSSDNVALVHCTQHNMNVTPDKSFPGDAF